MASRGNLAAWLSGPEKSRHLRQEPPPAACCVGAAAAVVGLDAWRAARSGLDDVGIGGGVPPTGWSVWFSLGFAAFPKPIVSADFLGGGAVMRLGGSTSASSSTGVGCSCLTLFLAGRAGTGLACTCGRTGTLGVLVFLNMLGSEPEVDLPDLMALYF